MSRPASGIRWGLAGHLAVAATAFAMTVGVPVGLAARTELAPVSVAEALTEAVQDEYHARDFYLGVIERLGSVRPFSNIVHAEERHAMALERLLDRYGVAVPSHPPVAAVPEGLSAHSACAAAATAERDNVALYDRLLRQDLPDDVRAVFGQLRRVSLERHLPAFERCGSARR